MICFPLDNTEYEANALGAWCGTRTRGVFSGDGHYAVTANGDMSVTLSPGLGWLKADEFWGICMFEANPTILTHDVADGSLTRIDAVCLRYDKNNNVPVKLIKKGAYAAQAPSIPPISRNIDYDEIYVAAVTIRAGATSILQSDIASLRLNEQYCGIMRDGVTGIPTQQLYDQWSSWMSGFTTEAQQYYGNYQNMVVDRFTQFVAEIAVHEQNAQQVYNAYEAFMSAYKTAAQGDFEAWYETIRGILSGDVAGNLINLIDALSDRVKQVEDTIFHDISANQHVILFENLDNIAATGYWNAGLQRIEC